MTVENKEASDDMQLTADTGLGACISKTTIIHETQRPSDFGDCAFWWTPLTSVFRDRCFKTLGSLAEFDIEEAIPHRNNKFRSPMRSTAYHITPRAFLGVEIGLVSSAIASPLRTITRLSLHPLLLKHPIPIIRVGFCCGCSSWTLFPCCRRRFSARASLSNHISP
jgi:hypothetical protein